MVVAAAVAFELKLPVDPPFDDAAPVAVPSPAPVIPPVIDEHDVNVEEDDETLPLPFIPAEIAPPGGDSKLPVIVLMFDTDVLTWTTELSEIFSSLGAIKSGVRSNMAAAADVVGAFDWEAPVVDVDEDDDDWASDSQNGAGWSGFPELIGLLELS